jgi:hypothetical protein
MSINELRENKIVMDAVKKFISDKAFLKRCESYFKKIMEDGKIDGDDVPLIINLVLMVYKNHKKVKIDKNALKDFFKLLICELIDRFKEDTPVDFDVIIMLLEPQIDLLFMSVKLPSCGLCGSKPTHDDERVVMNKIKINKLQKKNL